MFLHALIKAAQFRCSKQVVLYRCFLVFSFAAAAVAAVEVVNSAADFAVDFGSGLRCLVGCVCLARRH